MRRVLAGLIEWLEAPEQAELRRAFTVWIKRVLLPARLPGVALPEMGDLQYPLNSPGQLKADP